ncbi:MAG: hypothetical protein ACI8UO_000911 [Verrucomicrobiales bacterium]|jgi:hypothetical protein
MNSSNRILASSCWPVLAAVLWFGVGALSAENSAGGSDFSPETVGSRDFENLTASSPFTRPLNLAESLILAGVIKIDGRPLVTLIDQETKEVHLVSEEPNDRGWKIVEISSIDNLEELTAKISISGSAVTTLQFDQDRVKPPRDRKAASGGGHKDNRAKPTDEEKRKFSEHVRGRMGKMSEEQRRRVGHLMHEKSKANPKMSDRQKGELFVKILDHVEREGKKR